MDNNTHNKTAFMALYMYTEPVYMASGTQAGPVNIYPSTLQHVDHDCFVLLKPLSAISDDSKTKQLLLDLVQSWDKAYEHLEADDLEEWLEEVLSGNSAIHADYVSGYEMLQLTDYLRSKGYLLPFHDLTTEQLIEYGWAKLKTV